MNALTNKLISKDDLLTSPHENPLPVLRINKSGTILFYNRAGHRCIRGWHQKKRASLPKKLLDTIKKACASKKILTVEVNCLKRKFEFFVVPISKKDYAHIYGYDISDREAAQSEVKRSHQKLEKIVAKRTAELRSRTRLLEESEKKIRALYDQTYQFIGLMKPDGTLIEANRTALEFSGMELKDVLNRPFWKTAWWSHSKELQNDLRAAVKKVSKGEFYRAEVTHMSKEGTLHHIDFSLKPVKNARGKVIYIIPEGRDITDRKESEEQLKKTYLKLKETQDQLIQSEKLNAIGRFASGIAHDARNPLAILQECSEYLEKKIIDKDADITDTLKTIKNNIARADSIISSLLQFSRQSSFNLKPEDIRSILHSALSLVQARLKFENIDIIKEISKRPPKVLADKNRLEQVFVNVLLNAREAMPRGGTLMIRLSGQEVKKEADKLNAHLLENFRPGEKLVTVEIEDTGKGIPQSELSRIFEPFFTTKSQANTGLGLSITKSIVQMHEGMIFAESKGNGGTKIMIFLKTSTPQKTGSKAKRG